MGGEDWIGRRWLCLASQRLSWKRLGRCGIGSSSKVPQLNNFELVGRSIPPPFPHREDHLSLIMKSSHMNKIFPVILFSIVNKDDMPAVAMDQKPLYTEEIDHRGRCLPEAANRNTDTRCHELTSRHTSAHSNKQTC